MIIIILSLLVVVGIAHAAYNTTAELGLWNAFFRFWIVQKFVLK